MIAALRRACLSRQGEPLNRPDHMRLRGGAGVVYTSMRSRAVQLVGQFVSMRLRTACSLDGSIG